MLTGSIDAANHSQIRGWVRDDSYPGTPVSILVTADDQLLERVVANIFRPDLERAGIGNGRFGFDVPFNPPLLSTRPWLLHIRSEAEGIDLPGSPVRIAPANAFDGVARAAFAALIGGVASDAELDDRIGFLTAQRERLLQMRAVRRVGRATRTRHKPAATVVLRALVIDHRVPEPGRDGGSGALVSHICSLQRLGYSVTFAAPAMADNAAAADLERSGIAVCRAPLFGSVEEVLRREADGFDVVYLHRAATAAAYAMLVRQLQPRARLLYSVADLHHLRLARQAQAEDRPELLVEARLVRAQEVWGARVADAVITHSSVEAALLRKIVPAERVHTIAWAVPRRSRPPGFLRRKGIAFIGNFAHAPNAAAVRYLRDEILPRLHAVAPEIECRLVGHDAPRWLQAPQQWFAAVGPVSDLGEVFGAVRLTVALLGFGAGLKSKVVESLAAGIPCICSPIAAEGLELPDELHDLIVTDADAAVSAIIRLHDDAACNRRMADLGMAFAAKTFSENVLDRAMRIAVGDGSTASVTPADTSAPSPV